MSECRVLVVDDDQGLQYIFRELLGRAGYAPHVTGDPFVALQMLTEVDPHIAIVDLSMPKMNGLDLLVKLKEKKPGLIAIMITAFGTQEMAVKAIKSGADDYFPKPFSNDLMLLTLGNARRRLKLETENKALREERDRKTSPLFLGESTRMREVKRVIEQVAETDVTILINGESGTGKEMVATSLYAMSRRQDRPFVKLNCAALPESLIESELFGHETGAFTGATSSRPGKFEQAHGGTIFLDEIGDMTLSTQTKVLRVLQEREVERLGGNRAIPVDVRVITATNRDLEQMIREQKFRLDLYYRLNVVNIQLPPLRDRREDIPLLAQQFLKVHLERFGKPQVSIPPAVLERMMSYEWPGNVRELENGIARAVVLENFEVLVPPKGPVRDAEGKLVSDLHALLELPYKEAKTRIIKRFESYYLLALLERVGHNVSHAARLAQMDRKNFWVKVKEYLPDYRGQGSRGDSDEGAGED